MEVDFDVMNYLRKFSPRSFDWLLTVAALLLVVMGLAAIYSVDLSRTEQLIYFKKQLLASGIGLAFLITGGLFHYTFFRSYAKLFYSATLLLLLGVLFFGSTIRGTRGWFSLAGFSFQPVEVAKVGVIFILAYIVYHFGRRFERPLFFFGTGIMTLLPILLVMLQPDLGSAVLLGLIWFSIMLLVGARPRYIIGLTSAVVIGAIVAWFVLLHPYQKARILTFINPERDALGAGYNSTQAIIAVGAGKFFGRGLGFGSQSQLKFLPEAQTDFIFSVIAEELGLAGVTVLLILFGVLLWRLITLVKRTTDDFAAVTVSGIIVLFFGQLFINIGANIGLLPITGVTLPFVSYGGSSLIINLFLIGVAESMVEKKY